MKRVLLLTEFFRPEPGGLEALFTGIARAWGSDAIEVLVTKERKEYLNSLRDLEHFDASEPYGLYRPLLDRGLFGAGKWKQALSRELLGRIRSFTPEHIIFGDLLPASRMAGALATETGLPYSVFLNGNDLKNRLGLLHFRERRFVLKARNVFALSRFLAREARGYGISESRITVVPPFFEPRWPRFGKKKLPPLLHKKTNKKYMILAVGPLLPRKGLDVLIESFARLPALHGEVHLVLAGSGPEFSFLQELVRMHRMEEHVSLTGFVDDATLAALWKRADLFVQPGREREDDVESLGTIFLEAAWFGVPSIAGRLGGVDEIVRHGITGFVIEAGNRRELSEKLKQLIFSDRLRKRLGKNAQEQARREFDPVRVCRFINARL